MTQLTRFQQFSYQRFQSFASRSIHRAPHLNLGLQKAHIAVRPEVFLSTAAMYAVIAAAIGVVFLVLLVVAAFAGAVALPLRFLILLIPAPLLLGIGAYYGTLAMPGMTARQRTKDIDSKLPYALNYLSTMANAGATPERLFHSLAKQDIYGEVANEAAWIDRDVRLLGVDMLGALNKAIDRSPSDRFQDLMQGIITVLSSGGDLKEYLMAKADQFMIEGRQEQRRFMDSLGVIAESFVVVVVAAPLFMIVILSVMSMFGADATRMLTMGYLIVLIVLPLAQAGFAWIIKSMSPEA